MNYRSAPKIELHLHIDCSLSYDVVQKIDPSVSEKEYRDSFIAPPKCDNLNGYLERAVKGYEMMQTQEQLRLVTLDLYRQLSEDNIIYAEIRFAPLLHITKGLTPKQVVQTISSAAEKGMKKYKIEGGVILCTLRHFSEEQSMETVKLVQEFIGSNICGFDIAADEAGYPIDNHVKAFEYANEYNIPCTAHAGEACGAESVWETLKNFKPSRIGHGIRSAEDESLLDYLIENNIHLEVCPTSNIQTNVYDVIENHKIDHIYNKGVSMSVNTDSKTISNVTLTHEYNLLEKVFEWNREHFKKCNLEAINHAFTSEVVKADLRKKIEEAY